MLPRTALRGVVSLSAIFALLVPASPARAAGWDTPIVYTARHQAMGGTAIAAVDDPSASFHNPAGYVGVEGLEVLGSFSLLLGHLTASPAPNAEARNVRSDLVVAPFPLLGVGYRAHQWLSLGLGAYPVASGAASYEYPSGTGPTQEDRLRAVFYEISPGFSLNVPEDVLPGRLSIGAGYRITAVTFDRYQAAAATKLDLQLSGWDFAGVRVGAQYSPIEQLRLGVVFRNTVKLDAKGDKGTAFLPAEDISLGFVLPWKLGAGIRFDQWRMGVAVDYEFAHQSSNDTVQLTGKLNGITPASVDNIFRWQNGHTARLGVEYRAPLRSATIPVRAGYVFDGRVGNPDYPSAFGTPPAVTQSVTAGTGYHWKKLQVNLAVAYRFGGTTVQSVQPGCQFCSYPGDYKMSLVGSYLDFSYDFDL